MKDSCGEFGEEGWEGEEAEGGILVRKREDRYNDEGGGWIPPIRRGMREMPVVGEPMGIEAAEKLLVGTPGGDPTTLVFVPTFPFAFPISRSSLPAESAESYKSSKADRTALCIT